MTIDIKKSVIDVRMEYRDLAIGIMFLAQTALGILGNFYLLSYYLVLYYNECTFKPTDLILAHLIAANFLLILSKGVPHTMSAFGFKHFFNDLVCKFLLYVRGVGRSVSIGTTCILSVFRAITISPRNSSWKTLNVKAPKYISIYISICWILYMVVNFIFPLLLYAKLNGQNMTEKRDLGYFCTIGHDKIIESMYIALLVIPEVFLSVLIIWSSGSMVVFLYRRKQHVQHIHSSQVSHRTSPESRATQSIVILVSTFLAFYTISSILQGWITFLYDPSWWLMNITAVISLCFPVLGPFVLMSHNYMLSRLCFVCVRITKLPNSIVSM